MVQVDPSKRAEAAERFVSLAGLSQAAAEVLVDAAVQAAVDQTLDTITGSWAMPSTLTSARADELRYVCLKAGRALTQREVGVLFRTTSANAHSILTTMTATYEEELRTQFMAEMRSDAVVSKIGSVDAGLRWRVKFTQSATYDMAHDELERAGLLQWVDLKRSAMTIEFDQQVETPVGQVDILTVLGLTPPGPSKRGHK